MTTTSPDEKPSEEPKALTWGFRVVLLTSALYIAGCSAYFSVLGLGQLFTGSEGPVMVMAASLEVGKLVAASFLYRYWHLITGVLRFYLTLAVLVLIAITSLGNYGYLARAYEKTATTITRNETEIAAIEKTIAESFIAGCSRDASAPAALKSRLSSVSSARMRQPVIWLARS